MTREELFRYKLPSVRAINVLLSSRWETVEQLRRDYHLDWMKTEAELLRLPHAGRKTLDVIIRHLALTPADHINTIPVVLSLKELEWIEYSLSNTFRPLPIGLNEKIGVALERLRS